MTSDFLDLELKGAFYKHANSIHNYQKNNQPFKN